MQKAFHEGDRVDCGLHIDDIVLVQTERQPLASGMPAGIIDSGGDLGNRRISSLAARCWKLLSRAGFVSIQA